MEDAGFGTAISGMRQYGQMALLGPLLQRLDVLRWLVGTKGPVSMSPESMQLYETACDLAGSDDYDDERAVAEILRLTAGRRAALRRARRFSQGQDDSRDFEVANRADRLLEAAVSGRPVKELSDRERQRIAAVQHLESLSEEAGWQLLVSKVPQLETIAPEHPSPDRSALSQGDRRNPERMKAMQSIVSSDVRLEARLSHLLGPKAKSDDPLLTSSYALSYASMCITLPGWQERGQEV